MKRPRDLTAIPLSLLVQSESGRGHRWGARSGPHSDSEWWGGAGRRWSRAGGELCSSSPQPLASRLEEGDVDHIGPCACEPCHATTPTTRRDGSFQPAVTYTLELDLR
jgi:hypothetical protein